MPFSKSLTRLQSGDVFGRRPSAALFNFEAHPLTFIQALETFHIDGRVVDEYIATIVLFNKTESLFVIKPLNNPFCHGDTPPLAQIFMVPDFRMPLLTNGSFLQNVTGHPRGQPFMNHFHNNPFSAKIKQLKKKDPGACNARPGFRVKGWFQSFPPG